MEVTASWTQRADLRGKERTRLTGLCAWEFQRTSIKVEDGSGPDPGSLVSLVSPRGGQGSELEWSGQKEAPLLPPSVTYHGVRPSSQLCLPPTLTLSLCERTQPGGKCELKVCFSLPCTVGLPHLSSTRAVAAGWSLAAPGVGGCGCLVVRGRWMPEAPFSQEWKPRGKSQRGSQVPRTPLSFPLGGAPGPLETGGLPTTLPRPFHQHWWMAVSLQPGHPSWTSCVPAPGREAGSRGRRSWRGQPRRSGERHRRSASCSDWGSVRPRLSGSSRTHSRARRAKDVKSTCCRKKPCRLCILVSGVAAWPRNPAPSTRPSPAPLQERAVGHGSTGRPVLPGWVPLVGAKVWGPQENT